MTRVMNVSKSCARLGSGRIMLVIVGLAVSAMIGCKAKEAANTGFTQSEIMEKDPEVPFHKVWRKPGVDFKRYSKLYVADVNTEFMLKSTDWQKGERKNEIEQDVKKLGVFTKTAIEKAFNEDTQRRFVVLSAPTRDADAMIFEVAITEVVPSKVVLNALGYVPFGIGLTISAVRMIADDKSSVAFEARVLDASTREVIAMAADRESQQYAPISVRGLTWYSHAESAITDWAKQFVQIANRKPGETVKDTDPFTLKPW